MHRWEQTGSSRSQGIAALVTSGTALRWSVVTPITPDMERQDVGSVDREVAFIAHNSRNLFRSPPAPACRPNVV